MFHDVQSTSKRTYNKRKQRDVSLASPAASSFVPTENTVKATAPFTSILTSPNRLKDVKAKLAAPVPVGKLFCNIIFLCRNTSRIREKRYYHAINFTFRT